MKRPSFQFYPADWRKDSALQTCSLAARGMWIELMCVMHECSQYGTLTINGRPLQPAQIARLVGETEDTVCGLLNELEDAAIFSRDDTGAIFSRRMVKDERLRNIRAACGSLGGNPSLLNQKVNQNDNLGHKQSPTPSSSSSSSSSLKKEKLIKRKKSFPEDFEISPEIKAWAKKTNAPDPETQLESFRDYHQSHGSLFLDWEAAFRTWLRNAAKFDERQRSGPRAIFPPSPHPVPRFKPNSKDYERPNKQKQEKIKELLKDLTDTLGAKNKSPTRG